MLYLCKWSTAFCYGQALVHAADEQKAEAALKLKIVQSVQSFLGSIPYSTVPGHQIILNELKIDYTLLPEGSVVNFQYDIHMKGRR